MKKNSISFAVFFFMAIAFSDCVNENLITVNGVKTIGADIIVTLPASSVTLDGSHSKETGTATSYRWAKISGPGSYSIADPTSKTTLITKLVEGNYVFRLTTYSANSISSSSDVTVAVQTISPPIISSISPMSGSPGVRVLIKGKYFAPSPLVYFNGTAAKTIAFTDTTITTAVPTLATSGAISVTANGLTVTSTLLFTVLPPMYFHGNMSSVTITTKYSDLVFNGWNALKTNVNVESFVINNIGGVPYAYQKIQPDPVDPSKRAMYATILNDDPNVGGTTRAQMTLSFKDATDLSIYHTSHRMYLNPDIKYLQRYPSAIYWFELFEIWNKHVDGWDGDIAGSARWNLSLLKDDGVGRPLYWVVRGEYMQPANVELKRMWSYNNRRVPIPYGKWFTLDLYMKRGEGASGQMTITMTLDGGLPQVLFNIANTTIYPGHPEIKLKSWQPFKLYLNDTYLDWMSANGKHVSAYYNDFAWYKK